MQQLEIQFFYPLTDQITLDLDFTPSEQWIAEWRKRQLANSVTSTNGQYFIPNGGNIGVGAITTSSTMSSFVLRPTAKNAGKWEVTDSMFVYVPKKPNAVIKFFAKLLFGFKWHDEN